MTNTSDGRIANIVVRRELRVGMAPEAVFPFLSDQQRIVAWMGREATFEERPGGLFRIDYNGTDIVRGEVVEVVANERVVVTWGWEAAGAATPPGSSVVEFSLVPDGDETVVRLMHRGLTDDEVRSHSDGWDFFLPRLAAVLAE
jgi:uncharacterized protein YndB with AHSA1/START domain